MLAIAGGIILAGYGLVWWGYSIFSNNGNSFADVLIPGHYAKSHPGAGAPAKQGAPAPSSGAGK